MLPWSFVVKCDFQYTSLSILVREEVLVSSSLIMFFVYSDPEMILDLNIVSPNEVASILGYTLHSGMDPPLFASILPHMTFDVLTSALGKPNVCVSCFSKFFPN